MPKRNAKYEESITTLSIRYYNISCGIHDHKPTYEVGRIDQYYVYCQVRGPWIWYWVSELNWSEQNRQLMSINDSVFKSAMTVTYGNLSSATRNVCEALVAKTIAFMKLCKFSPEKDTLHQVDSVFVVPEHQRKGIGKRLYRMVLDNGINLASGETQTDEALFLWDSLSRDKDISLFIMDERFIMDRLRTVFKRITKPSDCHRDNPDISFVATRQLNVE